MIGRVRALIQHRNKDLLLSKDSAHIIYPRKRALTIGIEIRLLRRDELTDMFDILKFFFVIIFFLREKDTRISSKYISISKMY